MAVTRAAERKCGAFVLAIIIANEAAAAKRERYKGVADFEALAWRDAQAGHDPSADPLAQPNKRKAMGGETPPAN